MIPVCLRHSLDDQQTRTGKNRKESEKVAAIVLALETDSATIIALSDACTVLSLVQQKIGLG